MIVLIAFCITISSVETSYSQIFIGNTTSIRSVFMDHVNPVGCNELKINNITSNTHGNRRNLINMIDNNRLTSFSETSPGTWFRLDLALIKTLCYIEIAGFRTYNFSISFPANESSSAKLVSYNNRYNFPEVYNMSGVKTRYLDLHVLGNSKNNSTNISEIKVYAKSNNEERSRGNFDLYGFKVYQ